RHFEPLLDPVFDDLLRRQYRDGIAFEVDGRRLTRADHAGAERAPIAIRLGRRRTPSAAGFIERDALQSRLRAVSSSLTADSPSAPVPCAQRLAVPLRVRRPRSIRSADPPKPYWPPKSRRVVIG